MSIIKDFKAFISRGNVMDMAIGVIIGGAFGKIVTSLVNDIVMPGIGYLIGGLDFADMKYVMSPAVLDKAGEIVTPEVAICYGNFINTIIKFLIITIYIFLIITVIQKARAKFDALLKVQKEEVKEEPKVSDETKLLTEIRDLLKEKN